MNFWEKKIGPKRGKPPVFRKISTAQVPKNKCQKINKFAEIAAGNQRDQSCPDLQCVNHGLDLLANQHTEYVIILFNASRALVQLPHYQDKVDTRLYILGNRSHSSD